MEGNTKQTRAFDGVPPTSSEVRIEMDRSDSETTYWGVLCRTCQKLVAFDICPYVSFGDGAAGMSRLQFVAAATTITFTFHATFGSFLP